MVAFSYLYVYKLEQYCSNWSNFDIIVIYQQRLKYLVRLSAILRCQQSWLLWRKQN